MASLVESFPSMQRERRTYRLMLTYFDTFIDTYIHNTPCFVPFLRSFRLSCTRRLVVRTVDVVLLDPFFQINAQPLSIDLTACNTGTTTCAVIAIHVQLLDVSFNQLCHFEVTASSERSSDDFAIRNLTIAQENILEEIKI